MNHMFHRIIFFSFVRMLVFILLLTALVAPSSPELFAQSLPGTSGYYHIPSADHNPDKTTYFGTNLLNKKYLMWGNPDYHAMNFFFTTTYLPFVELSVRFTRKIDMPEKYYESTVGDRMMSARFNPLREGKWLPSVVVGFQNFFTTLSSGDASHFNSTYIVATKNIEPGLVAKTVGVTIGYGSDILQASDYQFIGFFGGVRIVPEYLDFLELLLEYDAERWNAGARITILKHLVLLGGLEGLDAFSGGISYRFTLP